MGILGGIFEKNKIEEKIKNFDKENSRTVKLRKPEIFIPIVISKTQNQINKEWKSLTTKTSSANGRINNETILLRAK